MSITNDKITEANERISELEKELSDVRELKECLVQAQIKNFEEIGFMLSSELHSTPIINSVEKILKDLDSKLTNSKFNDWPNHQELKRIIGAFDK